MKRYYTFFAVITLLSLSFFSFKPTEDKIGNMLSSAMDKAGSENYVVWVYFKDKGPDAMARLSNPLSIVSQRSLDRRSKVKPAGELLDYTDIPLYTDYVNSVSSKVLKVRHGIKWLNSMSVEVNKNQISQLAMLDCVSKIELVERFRINNEQEANISSDQSPVFINPTANSTDDPLVDTLTYGTGNAVTQITQIK